MRNLIRFLILVLLTTPATGMTAPVVGPLDNLVDPSMQTEHVFRCDADCCDTDCPPLRYKCKAHLQIYDKKCGFDDEGDGIDYMTLIGKSKKSVFTKFYQVMEGHIYDGYNEAKVCLKFDKYCYAY